MVALVTTTLVMSPRQAVAQTLQQAAAPWEAPAEAKKAKNPVKLTPEFSEGDRTALSTGL